jgi:hypothetical protein
MEDKTQSVNDLAADARLQIGYCGLLGARTSQIDMAETANETASAAGGGGAPSVNAGGGNVVAG